MAAVAKVGFPSTSRTSSTLPCSSTTSLRTMVPSAASASTGYCGGTLCANPCSAPLDERMMTLLSPDSGGPAGVASVGPGCLASDLASTETGAFVVVESGGATAALEAAGSWTGAEGAAAGVGA